MFVALIYPEDPCAVFNAMKLCEMGNGTCELVGKEAKCMCKEGYTESEDGATVIAEASGSTLSQVVAFCEGRWSH